MYQRRILVVNGVRRTVGLCRMLHPGRPRKGVFLSLTGDTGITVSLSDEPVAV